MADEMTVPEGRELRESEIPQGRSWNLEAIQIYDMRDLKISAEKTRTKLTLDGESTRIAVLDTGVDYNHPELKHAIVEKE